MAQLLEPAHLPELARVAKRLDAAACEFLGHRFLTMGEVASDPILGDVARGSWGIVLIELEGNSDKVAEQTAALRATVRRMGVDSLVEGTDEGVRAVWGVRHRASPTIARNAGPGRTSIQFIEDVVVPPDVLTTYLEGLDEALDAVGVDAVVFGHAGDANVHVNPLLDLRGPGWRGKAEALLDRVTELVVRLGGTLSGEHGDGRIRAPFLSRVWSPAAVAAFRNIKQTIDPTGILNPGVILPLPEQDPLHGIGGSHA